MEGREEEVTINVNLLHCQSNEIVLSEQFNRKISPGKSKLSFKLTLGNPKLWWPNGIGEQNLYIISIGILKGSQVLDLERKRFGIRDVKLLQEPLGKEGTSFTFSINDVKVFVKGANWVPADSIIPSVTRAKYESLLEHAKKANINMLRVWGGGIYEDDHFYDLCDELGIMIWQDFMFACAQYPEDEEFVKEVKLEAEYNIKRLRNHPSIVIWCGNNENQWLVWRGAYKGERLYGWEIYHRVLPKLCEELDGTRPYWPSSPYGGRYPNSPWKGNRHSYRVFLGDIDTDVIETAFDDIGFLHYRNYAQEYAKFVSEFGAFLESPDVDVIKEFISEDKLHPRSESWIFHSGFAWYETPFYKILEMFIEHVYGEKILKEAITNPELYATLSQEIKCEGLSYGIEHFRRRKFYCSGCMFWMLNDAWPSISWSIIDYFSNPKVSYYAVKRAYAPIILTFSEYGWFGRGVSIWIVNDLLQKIAGNLEVGLQTFEGKVKWKENINVEVEANQSKEVLSIRFSDLPLISMKDDFMYSILRLNTGEEIRKSYFFEEVGRVNLPIASLAIKAVEVKSLESENLITLTLYSDKYVRFVKIKPLRKNIDYSDNCFDLMPGEEKTVTIKAPKNTHFKIEARNSSPIRITI